MKETTITLRKTSLSLIAFLMVLFTVWSASAFYDNAENGLPTSRWELVNGLGDISYSADFAYGGSYSLKVNDSDASVPTYSVNYSGDFVVVDFWFYDDVISQIEFGVNTRNGAVLEWDNYLYVAGNVGVNYSIVSGTNYSDELIVDSAIVRSANWHHVVMNLNYSSDLRVAYIDDVLVLSETRSLSSPYTGAFYVAAYGGVSYADNIWINSMTGSGSVGDPYQITNCTQLQEVEANLTASYILMNNIDCSDTVNWNAGLGFVPLGIAVPYFQGVFDGASFNISDLYINRTDSYVGLFYSQNDANSIIKNVNLINVDITGADHVGGLVGGASYGNITDISVSGSIYSTGAYAGGVAGVSYGPMFNSHFEGTVYAGGGWGGGLIGYLLYAPGIVENCSANVTILASNNFVGGLIGYSEVATVVNNSHSHGSVWNDVPPNNYDFIGGLIGYSRGITANSYSEAEVGGWSSTIGGLVGLEDLEGTIINSYASGVVNQPIGSARGAGGLVGKSYGNITDSYATGFVNGTGWWIGGLVGLAGSGVITNSYASGEVLGNIDVGGLIGNVDRWYLEFDNLSCLINNSYSTGDVSGVDYVGGLIGLDDGAVIDNTYSTGIVTGSGTVCGGLIGQLAGTLTNSYSTSTVNGGLNNAGGLVGYSYGGDIYESYATGDVSGTDFVGGLIGQEDGGVVNNSYAIGDVSGSDYVGGLFGTVYLAHYDSYLYNSYAVGAVSGSTNVGGLIGNNYDNVSIFYISSSYWDNETSGQSSSYAGTGKTTAEMQIQSTFTDWDFVNIWEMINYPHLQYEGLVPPPAPAHIGEMPTYSKFDGNTTDFNAVYDLTSVAGVILENSTAAKISFNVPINVSGADLDSYVHVSYNLVGVDSVALPNLNVSANLSLQIPGFKFISILKDGVLCTDCSNVKYDGSLLTFTVSGFSNYSALNGTSVLYDDFETGSLNLTKWAQTSGTPSVSSNRAYNGTYSVLVDGLLLHRLTTLLMNDTIGSSGKVVLQFFVNLNSSDSYDNFQFSLLNSAGADLLQFQAGYPISGYWGLYAGSWTDSGISSTSGAGNLHNKWVRMRVLIDNDNNQTSWRIGDSNVSAFTGVSAGEIASQLKFYGVSGNLFYVDDVSFWDYDTFGWGNVTPYTGCMPDGVAENNEHYNLTQDCTLNEFTVGNDVVVDCNGYSLIMSGTSNAAGTFVNMYGSNGVVLNNCVIVANITGASFPSWLSVRGGGDNIVINNLTVRNSVSTFRGIWIGQETEAYTNNVTINGLYFDNVTTGSTGDSVVSFAKGDFLLKDSVWENMYVMGYLIHLYPLANVEVNNVTFRNISGRNDQNHHLITGGAGGNLSLLPYLGVFNSVFDNVKAGAGATQIGSVFALGDGTYFDFIGNEVKNTNYQSGDAWTKQGNAWIHPSSYAGANMTHIVITGNNFHDMLMYNTTSAFGSTSLIAIISVPGQYWTYGVNISGNNFTNIDGLVFTSPSNQTIGVVVNNNRFQNVTCQRSICQVITSSSPNLEFSGNWMNESSEVSYSPGSTIRNIASSLFRDNVVINPRVSRVGSSSYGGFAIHGPNSTVVNNTFYYDRQWYDDAYGNYPSCNSGNVTQYRLEVGLGCFASDNRIIVDPAVLTLTNPRCSTPITTVQVLACNDILYENNNISVRLSLGGSGSVRLNGTVRNNVLNGIQIGNLNGSTVEIYNNSFVAETQCGPDCHSMSATFSSATNDVLGSTVLFHDNYIENPIVIFSINKGGTVALPASSRNMNVNVYNNNFANYTKTYLDQYNASVNGNIQYGLAINVASANVNFTNNTVVKHLVQFGTTQISNNSVGGLITFADNGVVADLAIITITQSVQTNGSNPNIVFDGNTWDVPKYYLRPINSVNGVVLDVLGRYPDLNSSELWNATNYRLIGCDYFNTDYSYGSLTYADAINCFAGATLDLFDGGGLTLDEIRLTSGNGTTGASVRSAVFTGWNLKNPIYAGFSYDYAVWQNVSFAGSALTYWSSPVQMYDYGPILFTNVTNASLSGAVFYNSNGMINYTGSIDLTGIDNSTIDDAMYINNKNIGVTSQTYPGLNVSAKLSYFSTGVTNISDVEVLRNGNTCIAPQCDNFALVNDTVSFDILGFTNYVLLIGCIPNGQITGSRVLTADCTNRHWSLMGGSSLDCDSHVISESDILINGTVNLKNCVMTNTANECVNVVFGNGSLITGNDFSGCSRGAIWVNQ